MHSIFQKYYKRLEKEGWLKAFLLGGLIGCIALFICAVILWFGGWDAQWWLTALICVGVLLLSTAGGTIALYYARFQPSEKSVAFRLDTLGLKERMLTMLELQNDDSYIAMRQRQDAELAISAVSPNSLKIVLSKAVSVATSVLAAFSVGMTTVATLSSAGVLLSGRELWDRWFGEPPVYYEITYAIDGKGQLIFEDGKTVNSGETYTVKVKEGEDSAEVYASSANEWVFIEWQEDNYQYPTRAEKKVEKKMKLTAVFSQISGSAGDGNAMDMPNDLPPSDGPGEPTNMNNKNPDKNFGGGTYKPSNQIIDNKTYYGDEYDAAYDKIQEELEQDGEILDEQKDITAGYLGGIKADADEEDEDK